MCGVYMIRCGVNGFYYIGGTELPFEQRFDCHRSMLRRGKGPRLLQACYDLHGEESFEYRALQQFPPAEVAVREKEAIERLKPDLNIYHAGENRKARARGATSIARTYHVRGMELTLSELAERFDFGIETLRKRTQRGLLGEDLIAGLHCAPRKPYGS